jgi:broad specificity phosphatase PhoE
MVVKITYFVHGTTKDNIEHLASGQNDAVLAEIGVEQAKELANLRKDSFDAIFSSDLIRAVDSAKLAFQGRCPILIDMRLRECDYGDLTQKPKTWNIADYISQKYPNGESYTDVEKRIAAFLDLLKENYAGKHIAIVAHQAPQLAIEVLINKKTWQETIKEDWRPKKQWQPGWEYLLK